MTFDPDNPGSHKAKPKPAAPKKARNEWWKVHGEVYLGPIRKCRIAKEGKLITWIMHDE